MKPHPITYQQKGLAEGRLHGVDGLRAIAMLLGIVLHAMIPYKVEALPNWPVNDNLNHLCFDYVYSLIHSFRMPLFFVVAGFCSSLLFQKKGLSHFVRNRLQRIALPFGISLVVVLPLTILPFLFYRNGTQLPAEQVWTASLRGLLHWNGLAHLWFLYYLFLFYILFVLFTALWQKFSGILYKNCDRYLTYVPAMLLFAVLVLAQQNGGGDPYLGVDTGLVPQLAFPTYYFAFFCGGNLLYHHSWAQQLVKTQSVAMICGGLLLHAAIFGMEWMPALSPVELQLARLAATIQTVLLVLGCMGLALKIRTANNALWRYTADASYWVYLVHLGLIAGMQNALLHTAVPGSWRFVIVLLVAIVLPVGTYHMFVRYTLVGTILHGRREKPPRARSAPLLLTSR